MSIIYSLTSLREKRHRLKYYLFLLLITFFSICIALSYNLLLIYIFWEIANYTQWRLTNFYHKDQSYQRINIAFLLNIVSTILIIIGLTISYFGNRTFNSLEIKIYNSIASMLILFGILAKSLLLPIHTWFVPGYKKVPITTCSMLAGITINLGIIFFFRLFTNSNHILPGFFILVAWLATVTSITTGFVALIVTNIRDLLMFSMLSQTGFILLGLAVGGRYGITGGILYILAHALAQSGLFFGVGIIEDSTGKNDLKTVGGMLPESQVLGFSMALLAGSLVGFSPMIGFISKLSVVIGAVLRNHYLGAGAIASVVVTLFYCLRFYHGIFFGKKIEKNKKLNYAGITIVFILAMISLFLGIFFYKPVNCLYQ